jgi:NhaP-type Na+/H+ and K+/H+ antiporter
MWLMLLGNAGIVAAAGSLIIGFRGGRADAWRVLELALGLLLLVFVSRSRWVDRRMTSGIARVLNRFTDLPERDVDSLLGLADGYSVSEIAVQEDDWIAGRTLRDAALRDEGIVVLGVRRGDGSYLGVPNAATRPMPGDSLIVYGAHRDLNELDRRHRGELGDQQHRAAVRRYEEVVAGESGGNDLAASSVSRRQVR